MDPVHVPLTAVEVGDVIYAPVHMSVDDLIDPNSNSHTARDARSGNRINRLALVLEKPDAKAIIVTFLATFDERQTLPDIFIKQKKGEYWYPIVPAKDEGIYRPVEVINLDKGKIKAQWASLRNKQLINDAVLRQEEEKKNKGPLPPDAVFKVKKVVVTAGPETVATIRGHMKA